MNERTDHPAAPSLHGSFSASGDKANMRNYRIPDQESVLAPARELLAESETGQYFLELAKQRNIDIALIRNKDMERFVPDSGHAFIGVSPGGETPTPDRMALLLSGAIREAEHFMIGYEPPDENTDPVDFMAMSFAKELDVVLHMCRVADEIYNKHKRQEILDALDELGHSDVYQSYVNGDDIGEMMGMMVPEDMT